MSDYLGNPALIYEAPDWCSGAQAPLILIHDGGGTTFSYHCLDPTDRTLYGVENAHLHEGGWWDGGIPEMARHYIELISKALPEGGEIILGGKSTNLLSFLFKEHNSRGTRWSMGGILSLEMSHQIATNTSLRPRFRVLGIVMIDSICPYKIVDLPQNLARAWPTARVDKSPDEVRAMKLKDKVDLNMTHARVMIQHWDLPAWGETTNNQMTTATKPKRPPPTILLRAKDAVDGPTPSFVDGHRHDHLLGWGPYSEANGNFIRSVVDIQGHHFSIFQDSYIAEVTKKICAAANTIEDGFPRQR